MTADTVGGVWSVTPDMSVSMILALASYHCYIVTCIQVLFRDGTGHGKEGLGSGWVGGLGKMKMISVGPQVTVISHNNMPAHTFH